MGQKVSPHGLRVGVIKDWDSKWYAKKEDFSNFLIEDNKIREYIKKKLYAAGISKTVIERKSQNKIRVTVLTERPGIVIGRSAQGIKELTESLEKHIGKSVDINIVEVSKGELDATLSAENIAQALERRVSFRRAMKQAIGRTMKSGAKGIKVLVSGRLGGAEIARSEKYAEGNVPLHTIRANIDYGFAEADTMYGKIGVKVWINLGEILEKGLVNQIPAEKKNQKKDNRRGGDRPRRDRRDGGRKRFDDKPELPKAINPRKRKTPKPQPVSIDLNKPTEEVLLEGSQVETSQVETAQVEEAQVENVKAEAQVAEATQASETPVAEVPAEANEIDVPKTEEGSSEE
jgi:small subunit ribosomal protein S3